MMKSIKIFQSFVNIRTVNDYIEYLIQSFQSPSPRTFFYLNTYSSYLCHVNPEFKNAFNKANYIIPDGTSIVFALKHLKGVIVEKVTVNHTFVETLASYFDQKGISLFLFGGTEDTVGAARAKLQQEYPGITIAGSHHGYIRTAEDTETVISLINKTKPIVLFVGMGMPQSEIWIDRNKHRLNVSCIVTVGNLFEIIAGKRHIAPGWIINSGCEWIYRLLQEPSRLAPRYFKANTYYVFDLIRGLLYRNRS